jgi:hypothetical protein
MSRYTSVVGALVYEDGSTFDPPVILRTHNGWVYKPDVMRTPSEIRGGRNRSFPRKTGSEDAHRYLTEVLTRHHNDKGWQKPKMADHHRPNPHNPSFDSLAASFRDDVFGWVTVTMRISKNPDGYSITTFMQASALFGWLFTKSVDNRSNGWSESNGGKFVRIEPQVKAFMEDPFGYFYKECTEYEQGRFTELLDPPSFSDEKYVKGAWEDDFQDLDIFTNSSGNGLFYRKGEIKEIFQSEGNWEKVEEFFSALSFVGFTVRPTWDYGSRGWGDRRLSGLHIDIPKRDGMHRHSIYIDASDPHVGVECGYMLDEQRWLERKQREAKKQFADLEADLQTIEYTIDLD